MKGLKKFFLRKTLKVKSDERDKEFVSPVFLILPEEKVTFKTNPHWLFVVIPEIGLTVSGVSVFYFLSSFPSEPIPFQKEMLMFLGAGWCFVMAVVFLHWLCAEYYLTNLRLIEQRGIIGKRIMSIWLDKVQDVTCKFGVLGRIFGFGDIEIQSAGTYGKISFSSLPSPRKLREEIEKAVLDFHQQCQV